jgi:pyrroline-5-carboxylate reductase
MATAPKRPALKRAVLVGAGRMGSAMARGWVPDLKAAGLSELDIVEPDPSDDVLAAAQEGLVTLNSPPMAADILVLAVKPQAFPAAALRLKQYVGNDTLVISIMAGVTLDRIILALGALKAARAMPNTPGSIGAGVTAFCLSDACGDAESLITSKLLDPLGVVVGPINEKHMDAVTAVSGSGPAYVFHMVEALAEAGRAAGLPRAIADLLARETVAGAAALLGVTGDKPDELRKAVTSPGGTTAAALEVLMGPDGLTQLMTRAVEAAARRGAELAKEAEKNA